MLSTAFTALFVAFNYPSEQTGPSIKQNPRQYNHPLRHLLNCKSNRLSRTYICESRPEEMERFNVQTDAKKRAFSCLVKSITCIMDQHTHSHVHKGCCIRPCGPVCGISLKGLRHKLIKTRNGHVLITDSDVRLNHLGQNCMFLFQMVFQMLFYDRVLVQCMYRNIFCRM